MKIRSNFAFRFEWSERIANLSANVRLEVYEITIAYAQTNELPECSEEAKAAFDEHILPDFRRRAKAAEYRARAKERKKACEKAADSTPANSKTEETPVEKPVAQESDAVKNQPLLPRSLRRKMEQERKRKIKKSQRSRGNLATSVKEYTVNLR